MPPEIPGIYHDTALDEKATVGYHTSTYLEVLCGIYRRDVCSSSAGRRFSPGVRARVLVIRKSASDTTTVDRQHEARHHGRSQRP